NTMTGSRQQKPRIGLTKCPDLVDHYKLMPDKDWQLYRLSERADEETHGGSSLDFARLVIESIPWDIRPSLRSLFG
ncbi:hypothetical protein ACLH0B_08210, partial [Aeromonas salmonicida]|uniref:hypothetical protein n=1 Tax=Aeromonas salmonicida TaxID=645 RepID=UPI003D052538